MAIVPVYPELVMHGRPLLPVSYSIPHYPTFYPHMPWHPVVCHHPAYVSRQHEIGQYTWTESNYDYKFINAINNPGNFWIWPSGQ